MAEPVAMHCAFNGTNLRAISAPAGSVGLSARAAFRVLLAVGLEQAALFRLVDAGVSLSPAQQARLDQLQALAPAPCLPPAPEPALLSLQSPPVAAPSRPCGGACARCKSASTDPGSPS